MKPFCCALVLAGLAAAPIHGQTLGILGGMSRAMMSGVDELDAPRLGFTAGLSLDFDFSASSGLSLRGLYAQKGGEGELSFDGIPVAFAAIADYAEVSALLEVRPGGGAFRLLAGPSAAVNVKCTLDASYQQPGGQAFSESEDCDEAGDLETVDFGLTGGVGLATDGSVGFSIDMLYTAGLTEAITASGGSDPGKHRAASVVAGVRFPIGR